MPIYKINESSEMLITEGVISDIFNTIKNGVNNIKQSILDVFKSKLEKGCSVDYALKLKYKFDKKVTIEEAYCDPRTLKLFVKYVKECEKLYDEVGKIFKELENLYKIGSSSTSITIAYGDISKISNKADAFSKKCKKLLEDSIGSEFKSLKDKENIPVDTDTVEIYINRYRKAVCTLAIKIQREYEYANTVRSDGTIYISSKETQKSKDNADFASALIEIGRIAEEYLTISETSSPKIYKMLQSIRIKGKYGKK